MKILYFDCGMGAAGDMLTASLLELFPDKEQIVNELNNIGIPKVNYKYENVVKCGITGTKMHVLIDGVEEDDLIHESSHQQDAQQHNHINNQQDAQHNEHADNEHYDKYNKDTDNEHDDHNNNHTDYHHGKTYLDVTDIVSALKLSDKVKSDVLNVYKIIADAEGLVHGKTVNEIHFHEVGNLDAIADISAVCFLMDKISADKHIFSPVNLGGGTVKCAHGILPVPAPAVAEIIKGIPTQSSDIQKELCTVTGAAIIKYFADEFGPIPSFSIEKIGYGMGNRDFDRPNCVRVLYGQIGINDDKAEDTKLDNRLTNVTKLDNIQANVTKADDIMADNIMANNIKADVIELSCNLDDMTAEEIGFAIELFMNKGALDAYSRPIQMKKSRPGILLSVICKPEDKEKFISLIFKYTSTIGIRETLFSRYIMDRRIETVETEFGPVRKKISEGYGVTREKYEYEDLRRIALENDFSIDEVIKRIEE